MAANEDSNTPNDDAETPAPASSAGLSLSRLWPLVIVIGVIVAFFALGWDQYLSFENLKAHRQSLLQWTNDNTALAITVFILGYAAAVAFSLPGATIMTLGGGFLFGLYGGTVIVVTAATLGAFAIFMIARYALADFFRAKMGKAGERMEAGFKENALSYLLFLRLVPVFPFWLVNLVPAFLGVPARTFLGGTFVGIIPGTAVFCSVGNGLGAVFDAGGTPDLGLIKQPEILGPIIGLAVLSLVPIVYKRLKTAKS